MSIIVNPRRCIPKSKMLVGLIVNDWLFPAASLMKDEDDRAVEFRVTDLSHKGLTVLVNVENAFDLSSPITIYTLSTSSKNRRMSKSE